MFVFGRVIGLADLIFALLSVFSLEEAAAFHKKKKKKNVFSRASEQQTRDWSCF